MTKPVFSKDLIKINDVQATINHIVERLKNDVTRVLRRQGAVVGISGGIDSSVTLALAVKAFGADKVLGVMLPEKDSSGDSKAFALKLANKFGIEVVEENISAALDGFACYQRRDEAVKRVIPSYNPDSDKMKIVIPEEFINSNLPPVFYLTVIFADGREQSERLPMAEYLQIVAASNFKQRSRMTMLYYHAEARHYAVIGTPNKHEVQQGFFVKYGDGGADVMPIGDLYKTQVYELAHALGVPREIIERTPTTDTYSAEQTQEEFFYQMPFEAMDLLWYAWENGYQPEEVASVMGKERLDIERIFRNFERKKRTTDYLRRPPIHNYN
ncbi:MULTISPECIES: NAD(+) synthase [unclassified Carboxylicivirga]|uniref:NAD(+) synthase n=1 Tax=Carboxylicivirga TaxID=1628153 RepID=UPI003D340676